MQEEKTNDELSDNEKALAHKLEEQQKSRNFLFKARKEDLVNLKQEVIALPSEQVVQEEILEKKIEEVPKQDELIITYVEEPVIQEVQEQVFPVTEPVIENISQIQNKIQVNLPIKEATNEVVDTSEKIELDTLQEEISVLTKELKKLQNSISKKEEVLDTTLLNIDTKLSEIEQEQIKEQTKVVENIQYQDAKLFVNKQKQPSVVPIIKKPIIQEVDEQKKVVIQPLIHVVTPLVVPQPILTEEIPINLRSQKIEFITKDLLQLGYYYLNVDNLLKGEWNSNNINVTKLRDKLREDSSELEIETLLKEAVHMIIDVDPRSLPENTKKLLYNFVDAQIAVTVLDAKAYNMVGNYPFEEIQREKEKIEENKKIVQSLILPVQEFKEKYKDILDQKVHIDNYNIMPMSQWEQHELAEKSFNQTSKTFLTKDDEGAYIVIQKELQEHLKNKPFLVGKDAWQARKDDLEKQIAILQDKEKSRLFYDQKEKTQRDVSGLQKIITDLEGLSGNQNSLTTAFEKIGGVTNGITIAQVLIKIENYIKELNSKEFPKDKQEVIDQYILTRDKLENAKNAIVESRSVLVK